MAKEIKVRNNQVEELNSGELTLDELDVISGGGNNINLGFMQAGEDGVNLLGGLISTNNNDKSSSVFWGLIDF